MYSFFFFHDQLITLVGQKSKGIRKREMTYLKSPNICILISDMETMQIIG